MRREDWKPETIIALIVIIGGIILRCIGFDGEIWALVIVAAGFLFGNGYQRVKLSIEQQKRGIERRRE